MTLVGRDTTKLEACCESATDWWVKACAQSSFFLVSSRYCTCNLKPCCRYSRQVVLLSSAHSSSSLFCPSAAVCSQEGVRKGAMLCQDPGMLFYVEPLIQRFCVILIFLILSSLCRQYLPAFPSMSASTTTRTPVNQSGTMHPEKLNM